MTTCFVVVVVCIILFLSTYQPSKQCRKSNQSVFRGSLLLVHGCTNIKYIESNFKNRVFLKFKNELDCDCTTAATLFGFVTCRRQAIIYKDFCI